MGQQTKSAQTDLSGIFLFLWNCVNLFDLISNSETFLHLHFGEYYLPLVTAVSLIASLSYLLIDLSPKLAKAAVLSFCITQILIVLAVLPDFSNHRFVAALINVALIAEIIKSKSLQLSQRFIETAKILTSIVYGYSFLHKLNTDYLDPVTSCSTRFAADLATYYPRLSFLNSAKSYLPLLSIVVEGILATIYFLPRRLVLLVITLGFIFHTLLAIHVERHFFDFSSLMMTLLLLYIPCSKTVPAPPKLVRWFFGIGFILGYLALLNPDSYMNLIAVVQIRTRIWYIFSILIVYYGIKIAFQRANPASLTVKLGVLSLLIVIIGTLNGLTPYLGLKTRSSFDMYSNLKVEAGNSNHLFIPSSVQLGLLTDDVVDVIEIRNPEKIYPWSRPESIVAGKGIVRFQLMSILARSPGLIVKIRDEKGDRIISAANEVYANKWVAPWIMRKMIGFRAVSPVGTKEFCQW